MYPSSSLTNGALRRKPTIKVLNCDTPQAIKVPQVKSNHESITSKQVSDTKEVRPPSVTERKDSTVTNTADEKSERQSVHERLNADSKETLVAAADNAKNGQDDTEEECRVKVEPIKIEKIKVTPISSSPASTASEKPAYQSETSSDSAIGNSPNDSSDRSPISSDIIHQSAVTSSPVEEQSFTPASSVTVTQLMSRSDSGVVSQSKAADGGGVGLAVGSAATLPRPSSRGAAGTDNLMSQSATQSLRKPKKSSSTSARRSKSTNLLDKDLKEK